MRWPWVSRALCDYAQMALANRIGDASRRATHDDARFNALQERYDTLLEKYHALKLGGAVIPEPVRPVERKEPDPLVQAITVLSAGKPGLRTTMMQQLATDRANPLLDDADILQRIQSGMSVYDDEGVPG